MSLSWRLLISYIVIIVVCLVLAFVTLILVARPVQSRLAAVRLALQSRRAAAQINSLYGQGTPTDQILAQVDNWNESNRSRLLIINPEGTVLADSEDIWENRQLPLSLTNTGGTSPEVGTFEAPGGQTFTYAATPFGSANRRAGYVITVSPRSTTLSDVIGELGGGFIIAGGVALLVSVLLGIFIARSIALPLKQMANAANAIALGDYEHRLPETGPPEIKRVTGSFNVMVEQVESSQKAMRDFVSNVSHELKTPLTSIQGFSQAIMEGATPDEAARRRAAEIIYQEASRMTRMVEDLLDLARIESGQIVMNKKPLDLAQILESTINRLLPQAANKQVKLIKEWDKLPPVIGDGDRLAQVFTNFLDNAIRHTPTGGRITIRSKAVAALPQSRHLRHGQGQAEAAAALSEPGDFVEISIADTGPGIPVEDLDRIFERFYQVDKSRKRSQGTGLGLAISKEIVEAHNGYIRAESVEGVGTKFTIILPNNKTEASTQGSKRR